MARIGLGSESETPMGEFNPKSETRGRGGGACETKGPESQDLAPGADRPTATELLSIKFGAPTCTPFFLREKRPRGAAESTAARLRAFLPGSCTWIEPIPGHLPGREGG